MSNNSQVNAPKDCRAQWRPLYWFASAWLIFHWLAVLANVLAAPAGPWTSETGYVPPPRFARELFAIELPLHGSNPTGGRRNPQPLRDYLAGLKLLHNYHFVENMRAERTQFEARLLDANGAELLSLTFPDANAGAAVQHRQFLLAQNLVEDRLIEPPPGEYIPAPNQPPTRVDFWDIGDDRTGTLGRIDQHLIRDVMVRRNTDLYAPTPWAMVMARSYARYLCRLHGATTVELIRVTRDHVSVELLETPAENPEQFLPLRLSFGAFDASGK